MSRQVEALQIQFSCYVFYKIISDPHLDVNLLRKKRTKLGFERQCFEVDLQKDQ